MSITLRAVALDEAAEMVPVMDAVMQRAYAAPSFRAQIEWYVAVQPDAVIVAEEDGVVVGTGCGIAYPDAGFGWIGLIGTAPTHERRGIGAMVTERVAAVLNEHGCASALDASRAGAPLYARLGFTDHGPTTVLSVPLQAESALAATASPARVATVGDLDEIVDYDERVFGADRRVLIELLIRQYPGRCALVRDAGGAVVGWVLAQHVTIGPLAADDGDVLATLVRFAASLPWEHGARICVPPESAHLAALVELGCVPMRELRHMRRGMGALPGHTAPYAGRISLGIG
ncbi:MAG: family N-acetyltransferase [Ilumatobacteraceae bacterium]|nr:family N-acetyltransferase [Ilumatobacteraceae bacterium]